MKLGDLPVVDGVVGARSLTRDELRRCFELCMPAGAEVPDILDIGGTNHVMNGVAPPVVGSPAGTGARVREN